MPTAYIMVGVPASGKSSWIRAQKWSKDCSIVSTDTHVEEYAKEKGKTYSEVFDEFMSTAVELMVSDVKHAMELNQDIIWDQTSTTIATRRRKFNMLEKYRMIAVVMKTPPMDELKQRLASRPGKVVPESVVQHMIDNFEMPSTQEGFDEVWYAES
jgi:predicted kinase